jgi:hypothetical protein
MFYCKPRNEVGFAESGLQIPAFFEWFLPNQTVIPNPIRSQKSPQSTPQS